jgi:hypothetical protein
MKATSENTVSVPGPSSPSPAPRPAGRLTEAEFLDAQAEQAKAALRATLDEMKVDLRKGLSPLHWAQDHPWIALIGSSVGGFVAASTLVPSKEQQELARLRRIHEALHPTPKPAAQDKKSKAKEVEEGAIGGLLLRQLIGLIHPLLTSLLSAAMTARQAPPEPGAPAPSPVPDSEHPTTDSPL